jgi:hypothetical protein
MERQAVITDAANRPRKKIDDLLFVRTANPGIFFGRFAYR